MSGTLIEALLQYASGQRTLDAGQTLFAQGDRVRALFLLKSGDVRLLRRDDSGRELVVQRATAACIVAEASLYAERYHCFGTAASKSLLHVIPLKRLQSGLASNAELSGQWAAHLAAEVRTAREQVALLALRTVAERLDAWLLMHQSLPARGQWRILATQLGVSAEALYREIAKRDAI